MASRHGTGRRQLPSEDEEDSADRKSIARNKSADEKKRVIKIRLAKATAEFAEAKRIYLEKEKELRAAKKAAEESTVVDR